MEKQNWKIKAEEFLTLHLNDDNANAEEAAVYFLSRNKNSETISNTISKSIERWRNDKTQWEKKSLHNPIRAASILKLMQWGEIGALKDYRDNICKNIDLPNNHDFYACYNSDTSAFFPLVFPLFTSDIAIRQMKSKLIFLLHQWQNYMNDLSVKKDTYRYSIDHGIHLDQVYATLISGYIFAAYRLNYRDVDQKILDESVQCLLDNQPDSGLWGYDQTLTDSEDDEYQDLANYVNSRKHVVLAAMGIHALFIADPFGGKRCIEKAAGWLLEQQQSDGGWYQLGNYKYSYQVQTTVMVLDALELAEGGTQVTFQLPTSAISQSEKSEEKKALTNSSQEKVVVNINTVHIQETISNAIKAKPHKTTNASDGNKFKKSRFVEWKNYGNACFIRTDNNRIKFRHNDDIEDLKLGHGRRYYELMILLWENELSATQMQNIKEICHTTKIKPSDVVRQTNVLLNEKIKKLGFKGIPDNIKFIGLDKTTQKYRYYIPLDNDN